MVMSISTITATSNPLNRDLLSAPRDWIWDAMSVSQSHPSLWTATFDLLEA